MTELLILICALAVCFPFLKKRWDKQGLITWEERFVALKKSDINEQSVFQKLWILPCVNLIFVALLLGAMKFSISMLSHTSGNSFLIGPALRENLGIFGSIASDMYEDYRSEKISPYVSEAYALFDWGKYLLYAAIAVIGVYVLALKKRKIPKEILMGMSMIISIAIVFLTYKESYNLHMGMDGAISAEFLGLLGNNNAKCVEDALYFSAIPFLFLSFCTVAHYYMLNIYYDSDAVRVNPQPVHEEPTQAPVADEGEKRLEELLNLKNLYESGILSKDEMESMKSNILSTHTPSDNVIIEEEVQTQPTQTESTVHEEPSLDILPQSPTDGDKAIKDTNKELYQSNIEESNFQMYIWGGTIISVLIIIIYAIILAK